MHDSTVVSKAIVGECFTPTPERRKLLGIQGLFLFDGIDDVVQRFHSLLPHGIDENSTI